MMHNLCLHCRLSLPPSLPPSLPSLSLPLSLPLHLSLCLAEDDDWRDVCRTVSGLSAKWTKLARNLGLSANLIDSIACENPSSVDDCLSQALVQWLRCNYNQARKEPPSWRMLAKAVKPLSGRLFNDIKKEHPSKDFAFHGFLRRELNLRASAC